jgi:hypothetical protein
MLAPPGNLRQTAFYWNCSASKTRFFAPLETFLSTHRFAIMHMAFEQNYAGNNQKSYKTIKMQMFATLDKAKSNTGNIRGLILYLSILLHYNVYIQFPVIMPPLTFTIWPVTQHVSAADGHPQVFHYAKPATLHLVLSSLCVYLNNL